MNPKLKEPDANPSVTISVLATVGELAQVSGTAMRKHTAELLPIIIDMLQDMSSLQKREVSSLLWMHSLPSLIESSAKAF